ncbi:uncharacterized protein LOC135234501 isoform X2 [Anguilla rostrata]|uniref:uncharacterized protein LOC135234501 isoform X2 n=1 Tax=Anguilla rostrata TaxID=7938 RepID=UPI0030D39A72
MFSRCLSYLFVVGILRCSESLNSVNSECGENITLPCDATRRSKQYRSVTWYKVSGTRTGIIRKAQDRVQQFKAARMAEFGHDESLLVPGVRPEDSGDYECFLSANVGGENKESKLHLSVSECVTPADTTLADTTPVDTTPAALVTLTGMMSCFTAPCMDQVVEVSLVLVVTSFSVIAFVKVILSIFSVWVLLLIRRRGERQRMDDWS